MRKMFILASVLCILLSMPIYAWSESKGFDAKATTWKFGCSNYNRPKCGPNGNNFSGITTGQWTYLYRASVKNKNGMVRTGGNVKIGKIWWMDAKKANNDSYSKTAKIKGVNKKDNRYYDYRVK